MSHLSDIERIQIIMERERDGKTLSTIATRHHCTHATVRNIAENELRENDSFFCPPESEHANDYVVSDLNKEP